MREIVLTEAEVARFWTKVDKHGLNGCWVWTGFCDRKGYGKFWMHGGGYLAHRISYHLDRGVGIYSLQVHHICPDGSDNPACINPAHLTSGTDRENMDRRNALGRQAHGERSGKSKLTRAKVQQILATKGRTLSDIAREHGVSHPAIADIVKGRSWKHIDRNSILNSGTNEKY